MSIERYTFSDIYMAKIHVRDNLLSIYTYLEDGVIDLKKRDVIAMAKHFKVTAEELKGD